MTSRTEGALWALERAVEVVESQRLTEPAIFGGNKWGAAGAMKMVSVAAIRALAARVRSQGIPGEVEVPGKREHLCVCVTLKKPHAYSIRYHDGINVRWWGGRYWLKEEQENVAAQFVSEAAANEQLARVPYPQMSEQNAAGQVPELTTSQRPGETTGAPAPAAPAQSVDDSHEWLHEEARGLPCIAPAQSGTPKREHLERVVAELNLDTRDPFTLLFANACALHDQREELKRELSALRAEQQAAKTATKEPK